MKPFIVLLLGLGLMVNVACSNEESDHHHHVEARGVVLFMNGVEIVRLDSTILTGQITISANQQVSEPIEVKFIKDDVNRDLFQPEGDKHWMKVTVSDTAIIGLRLAGGLENKWKFRLIGKKTDTTDIRIQIYHIDHPDFTTPRNIPVIVL